MNLPGAEAVDHDERQVAQCGTTIVFFFFLYMPIGAYRYR